MTAKEIALAQSKSEFGGLLTLPELAEVFCVRPGYTRAMTRAGFKTVGGLTTRDDALQWLTVHLSFKNGDDQRPRAYLTRLPKAIPIASVLVHNRVPSRRTLGVDGFRAWLEIPNPRIEVCNCGWAPEIGEHYRVKAA